MSELDDKIVPKVLEVVTRFGKDISVTIPGTRVMDTANQAVIKQSGDALQTVRVTPPRFRRVADSEPEAVEAEFLIPASGLTFTPELSQKYTIDGSEFIAHSVRKIYSGNEVAAWKIKAI